jgi:hypothetical protein
LNLGLCEKFRQEFQIPLNAQDIQDIVNNNRPYFRGIRIGKEFLMCARDLVNEKKIRSSGSLKQKYEVVKKFLEDNGVENLAKVEER